MKIRHPALHKALLIAGIVVVGLGCIALLIADAVLLSLVR